MYLKRGKESKECEAGKFLMNNADKQEKKKKSKVHGKCYLLIFVACSSWLEQKLVCYLRNIPTLQFKKSISQWVIYL